MTLNVWEYDNFFKKKKTFMKGYPDNMLENRQLYKKYS